MLLGIVVRKGGTTVNISAVMPSLAVKDFDASLDWYTKLFDREPDRRPMDGTVEWDLCDGAGLQLSTSTETPVATVIVGVDDLEATLESLSQRGVGTANQPFTVPSGQFRLCILADPAGNSLVLSQTLD